MSDSELTHVLITGSLQETEEWMPLPLTLGVVHLTRAADGRVHLQVEAMVSSDDDRHLIGRAMLGVQAAVAAATGAAVVAHAEHASFASPAKGPRQSAFARVSVQLQGVVGVQRGAEAANAVLGDDVRLAELWEVFVLGLRATQTIAPVVGLWAFSTILEEEAPKGVSNLKHVPALMQMITDAGHAVDPAPARGLDEIRAAALHPTPKSPLPNHAEVDWFRSAAIAYLSWRAQQAMSTASKLKPQP